jgi:hypothetical protein
MPSKKDANIQVDNEIKLHYQKDYKKPNCIVVNHEWFKRKRWMNHKGNVHYQKGFKNFIF